MKKIITLSFIFFIVSVNAQDIYFTFQIAKPVCIANEYVPILFKKECKEDLYIYLVLSDNKNVSIQNEYLVLSKEMTTINLKLNENVSPGTKVISAFIIENDGITIIEIYSGIIHITDGKHNDYHLFTLERPDNILPATKRYKTSETITWMSNTSYANDEGFDTARDYIMSDFKKQLIPDKGFRKFYKSSEALGIVQNYIALNLLNKKTEKIKFDESKGIISYLFEEPLDADNWEIFDSRNMTKVKNLTSFDNFIPTYELLNSPFQDKYNFLYKDLLLNAKLNEYYEVKYLSEFLSEEKIIFDNEYIMSDYSAFENLAMFLKEVVFPLKTDNEKNIYLLSGVNKQWNKSKASLFIDDVLIEDHKQAFSLEWDNMEKIVLYRKIETFRQSYGSLGRNGVIEIVTKNKSTRKKKSSISFIEPDVNPDHKYINTSLYLLPSNQNQHRLGSYNVYNSDNEIIEVIEIVE